MSWKVNSTDLPEFLVDTALPYPLLLQNRSSDDLSPPKTSKKPPLSPQDSPRLRSTSTKTLNHSASRALQTPPPHTQRSENPTSFFEWQAPGPPCRIQPTRQRRLPLDKRAAPGTKKYPPRPRVNPKATRAPGTCRPPSGSLLLFVSETTKYTSRPSSSTSPRFYISDDTNHRDRPVIRTIRVIDVPSNFERKSLCRCKPHRPSSPIGAASPGHAHQVVQALEP